MTEPGIGPAIRSNARPVLAALRRRRLRLDGLDPLPRRLTQAALVASAVAAVLLMVQPLELSLPGGLVTIQRSDAPQIGRLAFAAALITISVAVGALAAAAADEHWRWWRSVVVGLGAIGLLISPSVLTTEDVPVLAVVLGLTGVAAALALIGVGIVGRPRRVAVIAPLAATPPLAAWLAVLAVPLSGADPSVESGLLTSVLNGVTVIELPLIALAVWAVIEYGRGLIAGGRAVLGAPARLAWLLPLAFVVKVAFLATVRRDLLEIPIGESVASIAWASLLALVAAWWLLHGPRIKLAADGVVTAAWWVLLALLIGHVLPLVAFAGRLVPDRLGIVASSEDLQAWTTTVDTVQHYAVALTPAFVATLALGAGLALLAGAQARWRGAAVFLLAYAAWTLPPGIANALNELADAGLTDGSGGLLGNINPVTLDLFVTGLVALLAIGWYTGLQRRVRPMTLLAVLGLSTVFSFAGQGLGGGLATVLFWLGFGFPFAAQFLFDAGSLNESRADRPARVLRASGLSSLALGMALPLVALEFARPGALGEGDLVKVLLLVPFVAVLLAGTIADAPEPEAAGLAGAPLSRYGMFAVLAVAVVAGGGTLAAFQKVTAPPVPTRRGGLRSHVDDPACVRDVPYEPERVRAVHQRRWDARPARVSIPDRRHRGFPWRSGPVHGHVHRRQRAAGGAGRLDRAPHRYRPPGDGDRRDRIWRRVHDRHIRRWTARLDAGADQLRGSGRVGDAREPGPGRSVDARPAAGSPYRSLFVRSCCTTARLARRCPDTATDRMGAWPGSSRARHTATCRAPRRTAHSALT